MTEFDPDLLDDEQAIRQRDTGALLWQLAGAGAAVRRGVTAAQEAGIERFRSDDPPRSVLVACDPFTADIATPLVRLFASRAPALVWDSGELPAWAGPADVLMVGCVQGMSASLARLVDQAGRRGLAVTVVAPEHSAVASAAQRGALIPMPADVHPWAVRWPVLAPLLAAAAELGLLPAPPELGALADALDAACVDYAPARESYENPAKTLAVQLGDSYPIVVGMGTLAAAAAETIAHSLQRIAGERAVWAPIPSGAGRIAALLAGSEVADLEADFFRDRVDDVLARPRLIVVGGERDGGEFRPPDDDPADTAARRAMSALERLAERSNLRPWPVEVPDATGLCRYACAAVFGDFVATYLALANYRSTEADIGIGQT